MDKNDVSKKILEKISMAIECISQNRDADFNEKNKLCDMQFNISL